MVSVCDNLCPKDKYGKIEETQDRLPENHIVLETFCMKCGGCFYSIGTSEQENLLRCLQTLKNVARFHRNNRGPHVPYSLLVLAKSEQVERQALCMPEDDFQVYMISQVSLSPLDLCLWRCKVSPHGVVGSENCAGVKCPKAFTASLDFRVNSSDNNQQSLTEPALHTMHQMAFDHRFNGFWPFELRLLKNYRVVSLMSVVVDNADDFFTIDADQAVDDEEDEEDPTDTMMRRCMALLKDNAKGTGDKAERKNTASDEPRLKRKTTARKQQKTEKVSLQPEQLHGEVDELLAGRKAIKSHKQHTT